jgi:hypothetical protein
LQKLEKVWRFESANFTASLRRIRLVGSGIGRAEGRGKEGRERSRLIREEYQQNLCTDKKLCFISFTVLQKERLPVLVVKA